MNEEAQEVGVAPAKNESGDNFNVYQAVKEAYLSNGLVCPRSIKPPATTFKSVIAPTQHDPNCRWVG